jgi:hypothetical protein
MMDYLREQVALLRSAGWITHANEFAECVRALQVIHTWASIDSGRLNAADVKNMAKKALAPFMQHQATRKR